MATDIIAQALALKAQASLGASLRQQGWSVINSLAMSLGQATLRTPNSMMTGAKNGITAVYQEVSATSVPAIRIVHGNWTGASLDTEAPAANDILVKAAAVDANGLIYPFTHGPHGKIAQIASRQINISDPLSFRVVAGTPYKIREYAGVQVSNQQVPTLIQAGNAALSPQPNMADAIGPEDSTEGATGTTNRAQTGTALMHQAILGYTGATPAKSIAAIGDSIGGVGLGDAGSIYPLMGGLVPRVATGITGRDMQWPVALPRFGWLSVGHAGARLVDFVAQGGSISSMMLASLTTTVINNYGINDLVTSVPLATLKANTLTLASICAARGQKFIQCTLYPYASSSSDGFITVANQVQGALESNRQAFNTWLRDTSATGFLAQAKALVPAGKFAVYDVCTLVEVNSSGVLTLNGGYWKPPAGSYVYSGSITSGSGNTTSFSDSGLNGVTANTHRGRIVRWTSGPNANKCMGIATQTATGLIVLEGALSSSTTASNAFEIWDDIPTREGTHPSSYTYATVANAFPVALIE